MKKKSFSASLVLFAAFLPVCANAADIRNVDNKPYTLIVKSNTENFKTVIEANGCIKDLCSDCTVEVEGYSISDIQDGTSFRLANGVLTNAD